MTNFRYIFFLFFLTSISAKLQCSDDQTCTSALTTKYSCNLQTNTCEHSPLSEFTRKYIIGIIIIIIISALANAGGIGGGSVIVPALIVMFSYEVNEAIPLSKATIFAGAVINVFFLLNQRSEQDVNKSLIDYRLCAFMLPIMMGGTFFGVYLNFIVPQLIIFLLLTGYLLVSILSIFKKYKILNRKENRKLGISFKDQIKDVFKNLFKRKENGKTETMEAAEKKCSLVIETNVNEAAKKEEMTTTSNIEEYKKNLDNETNFEQSLGKVFEDDKSTQDCSSKNSEEKQIEKQNKISFPRMILKELKYIFIMFSTILVIMTLSLLKEGFFFPSGSEISRCSGLGISVMVTVACFCLLISVLSFRINIKSEAHKPENSRKIEKTRSFQDIQDLEDSKKSVFSLNDVSPKTDQTTQSIIKIEDIVDETHLEPQETSKLESKKMALYKLGSASLLAGLGAGLLGIGGGMIINPFLIFLDYSPYDAIAISSMGVLFTSTISTFEFLVMGAIRFSDLKYFLFFTGIGSLCGVFLIKGLIRRFQRESLLLLIILGIFISAMLILPTFGLYSIPVENYFKFRSLCS